MTEREKDEDKKRNIEGNRRKEGRGLLIEMSVKERAWIRWLEREWEGG